MKVTDEIVVSIEKLSNLGFGIAKHEGLVVFVENACSGDELKVKITKLNKNWANAKIVEIINGSAHRAEPFCALHKVCGGCQLQFIDYEYQLELKKQIIEDAMKSIGGLDVEIKNPIASPENLHYRHKVQYPISQTKVSRRILAGYYKPKSHEIVNIKHCPIQPEICDTIIEFIRNSAFDYGISGFNEKKHSGDLRHVVIRVSKATGKILITLVVNSSKTFDRLKDFTQNLYDNFKEISGVCVNFNSKKTNVILGVNTELIAGKDFIKERILDKTFKIGANTFFQINPASAENIFEFVKAYIKTHFENSVILDAYAGVSAFGITVSDICKKVVSVEENKESVDLAAEIIELNEIKNIELHNMDTQKFFGKYLMSPSPPPPSPLKGEGKFIRCNNPRPATQRLF
jgi:23S rRNA (uracil1939-C5)-methyltransferase